MSTSIGSALTPERVGGLVAGNEADILVARYVRGYTPMFLIPPYDQKGDEPGLSEDGDPADLQFFRDRLSYPNRDLTAGVWSPSRNTGDAWDAAIATGMTFTCSRTRLAGTVAVSFYDGEALGDAIGPVEDTPLVFCKAMLNAVYVLWRHGQLPNRLKGMWLY